MVATKVLLGANSKVVPGNWRVPSPNYASMFTVMASPPTLSSGTSATLARQWSATSDYIGGNVPAEWFTLNKTGVVTLTYPSVTYGNDSVGVSFLHYGTAFEIDLMQSSTNFLIKINDQFVSLTPTSTGTTGGAHNYFKYVFASAGWHRVDIIGYNIAFRGVYAAATDTIIPAPNRGPRTIFFGDSFTQGSSFLAYLGFAEAMGWDDVAASGVAGTGYLSNQGNTAPTLRQRVLHDVIAYSPEVVVVFGGTNDGTQTPSAVQAEALLLYQTIAASLPSTLQVVTINTGSGVGGRTANQLAVDDAIRAAVAAAKAQGISIAMADLLGYALGSSTPYTAVSVATGAGSPSAGSSAFGLTHSTNNRPVVGSTYSIGSGATYEKFQITAVAAATSTITNVTLAKPLTYAHTAGDVATLVGSAFWSGNGNSGTPSGWGNCDVITSSDGLHPNQTFAGNGQLGLAIAAAWLQATGPN